MDCVLVDSLSVIEGDEGDVGAPLWVGMEKYGRDRSCPRS